MAIKELLIGIDFGTTFSFCCYLNGDAIVSLTPTTENYGIPSLFFDNGKQKAYGKIAAKKLESPAMSKYVVSSVKRRLDSNACVLDNGVTKYNACDVIREIMSYVVDGAIKTAQENYAMEFTDDFQVQAVVTVPISFTEPMKKKIEETLSAIVLPNGKHLLVRKLIPEPVAAAIDYFGITNLADKDILVYDLGGGTFDAAWVHSNSDPNKTPYVVANQNGDSELGGDDWDKALADWLRQKYLAEYPGDKLTSFDDQVLQRKAREYKEELTNAECVSWDVELHGNLVCGDLSRAEFESLTKPLLDRTLQKVRDIIARQQKNPDYIILTGGSSNMPQVKAGLMRKYPGIDIRLHDPAHAIANGAARFADWLRQIPVGGKEAPKVQLISSHAYGIEYHYNDTDSDEILILIPRGQKLPYSNKTTSFTRYEDQYTAVYKVYELDVFDKAGVRVPLSKGRHIMSATLQRPKDKHVPKGTETTDTLTLSDSELLSVESVDNIFNVNVTNNVQLKRN